MTSVVYDVLGERARYAFPDVVRGGVRINRGTARPQPAACDPPGFQEVRERHAASIVASTLAEDAPAIELDRPVTGIYVASRRGVYLDLHCGVAQRLFDDERLLPQIQPLLDAGLLLRREINTDDYLGFAPPGVRLPQDLAELAAAEAQRAFPRPGGYRLVFSNSGTEAIEAGVKAAARTAYHRFLRRHGAAAWAAVCRELGIGQDVYPSSDGATVWRDHPLFFVALEGAFHGRTLGSLSLTKSRPVQREGYPTWRWVRHVPVDDPDAIDALIDPRPVEDLLQDPGALSAVIRSGRIPADLLAGIVYEPLQGEGGYRLPPTALLRRLRAACDRFGALLIADEVQTFARGGSTFFSQWHGVRPDVICLAKAAILGMTIVPAEVAAELEPGWHSTTFGSGKLFDVNYAYAVMDTWLHGRDPLFEGMSFAENEQVKGEYLAERLDGLVRRFPEQAAELQGAGCMWGLTVRDRPAFIGEAWRQGAKVLGAGAARPFPKGRGKGAAATPGRIRLILPADVLTREIDDTVDVLARTCAALEEGS